MNELIIAMAVSAAALLSVSATNAAEPKAATDISAQHRHHRHHGHHHYRHHHHQYAHHRHYRPYYGTLRGTTAAVMVDRTTAAGMVTAGRA
jgi:hypothetical protein